MKKLICVITTITIIMCIFTLNVFAVDYSTMTEDFENINIDELTDEEIAQLQENENFMIWYMQQSGIATMELHGMKYFDITGNVVENYRLYTPDVGPDIINVYALTNEAKTEIQIYFTAGNYHSNAYDKWILQSDDVTYKVTLTNTINDIAEVKKTIWNLIFNGKTPNNDSYVDVTTIMAGSQIVKVQRLYPILYTKNEDKIPINNIYGNSKAVNIEESYIEYSNSDIYIPPTSGGDGEDEEGFLESIKKFFEDLFSGNLFDENTDDTIKDEINKSPFFTSITQIKDDIVEIVNADYTSYKGFVATNPLKLTLRRAPIPGYDYSHDYGTYSLSKLDFNIENQSIIGDMKWFFGTHPTPDNPYNKHYTWENMDGTPAVKWYSDRIIGAFMWIIFAWALWKNFPNLIGGEMFQIGNLSTTTVKNQEREIMKSQKNTGEKDTIENIMKHRKGE